MVEKPNVTRIWASAAAAADIVDPDVREPGKFAAGWTGEIPPYEYFNFLHKLFTQVLAHINERGIAEWDANTQYLQGMSYVQRNGQVYRAVADNKGRDPASSPSHWQTWPPRIRDIPVGTRMIFVQATTPVGWTRVTEHNNKALRIVSGNGGGSGGSVPFTTALHPSRSVSVTVNGHTLTLAQIPSHTHVVSGNTNSAGEHTHSSGATTEFGDTQRVNYPRPSNTSQNNLGSQWLTSSAGNHSHTINISADHAGGGGSHNHSASASVNLSVQYVDAFIAEKDV